jgi:hypothetical protein
MQLIISQFFFALSLSKIVLSIPNYLKLPELIKHKEHTKRRRSNSDELSVYSSSSTNNNEIDLKFKKRRRHRTHRQRTFYREASNIEMVKRSSRRTSQEPSRNSSRKSSRKSSKHRRKPIHKSSKAGEIEENYEKKTLEDKQIDESQEQVYEDQIYESESHNSKEKRYEHDPLLATQATKLIKHILNSIKVKSIDFTFKQE